MANKVTIEVEALLVDQVTGKTKYVISGLDGIEQAAKDAQKSLDQLGKKKVHPVIDADNNRLLKKLRDSENRVARLAGKTFTTTLKVVDKGIDVINKAEAGLKNITKKTWTTMVKIKDLATAPLRRLKDTLFSIKSLVMAITAGLAAKQFILNPINLADQYSGAKIGFSTLLGEAAGQQMMDQIDQFAKETPFKTSGVISNVQKMMAYGWDVDRVIDDMKTIGDAAAATGKGDQGLESIVYALSEIRSKGKLSTQEINQLASAGIKAKAYLAEGLGFGTDDAGMKKLAEALEDGAIGANQAIDMILEGMKEFNGMMDATANETVEGLKSQLADVFEINVARRWGQGLQDGAKRGLGSVVKLLDEASDGLEKFGDTIYDIGNRASNWVADKFENAIDRIMKITDSFEFQEASLGEKISMLWKGVVADPLKEWWDNGGEQKTAETAGKIGSWMGMTITKGLLAVFGATDVLEDGIDGVDAGSKVAGSFVDGFLENFDGQAITDAFVDAISNVWNALPTWAKWTLGIYGGGKALGGIASFAGGVASFFGGLAGTVGSAAAGTGILGHGVNTAIGLGAGNLAGGASLGAGALSAVGLGATAGGLAGGVSLVSGGMDLYRGYTTNDETEALASKTSGYSKVSGVGTGAAMGALIGSVIPGLGTAVGALIGAGIGGVTGWIAGDQMADGIRAARYESEELQKVLEDEKATQEEINTALAKAKWENAREHFGDIKLSLSEINRLVDQIVWGDDMGSFEKFQSATKQATSSLESMKAAAQETDRWMWKAGLGVQFNEDERESITGSFNEYIAGAQAFLENKHYEFTASAELLLDLESKEGKGILESGNAFYMKEQEALSKAGEELGKALTEALADGIITAPEEEAIIAAQNKIAEIMKKISDAEQAAEIELIKVKFSGDNLLDKDSFDSFMVAMKTNLEERVNTADEAFEVQVKNLKLRFPDGGTEYETELQNIINGYKATVEGAKAEILDVELNLIGGAYSDALGEDAVADLNRALQHSINEGLSPIEISDEKMAELLKLDLTNNGETIANIKDYLNNVFGQLGLLEVDADVLLNSNVSATPDTSEKAKAAVDESVPDNFDDDVMLNLTGQKGKILAPSLTASDFGVAGPFNYSPTVNVNPIAKVTPLSGLYNKLLGGGYTGGIMGSQNYSGNGYRGGIFGGSSAAESFYRGGMVRGGSKLIEVAEEGTPEMIIPLSSQRRERGLKLWEKAGEMLNVPGFARGGLTNGGQDEGLRHFRFGASQSAGDQTIHVDVGGITFAITVNGTDATSIAAAIKEQIADIAEDVAGVIADAFAAQFENTPVRGGVA